MAFHTKGKKLITKINHDRVVMWKKVFKFDVVRDSALWKTGYSVCDIF